MARSLAGAWCLLLTFSFFSQGITLKEAERKALENSPLLKMERLELIGKGKEAEIRFGDMLPRVDLELSLNFSRRLSFSLPPLEFTFQKEVYPKATLFLRQDLLNLASKRTYEISRILEKAQSYLLEEKKLETLYKVREAYVNALKAKAVVSVYRRQVERTKSHLRDVEEMFKEGIVAFRDLLEARVRLHEAKERLLFAEAEYRKALSHLSYLVGEEVKDVEELKGDISDLSKEPLPKLEELLRRKRPLLKFLRETLRAKEKGVEVARSYFYPVLSMEGFLQYTEETDLFPRTRYLVSFSLRWNLFSGLKRLREVEKAKIEKAKEEIRLRDIEEKLLLELRTLLEDIKSAKAKVELAKKRVEEAKESLRIAEEKFKEGLGTATEVLDAESYLTYAEQTLKINTYDLILKIFKLQRVVGYEG